MLRGEGLKLDPLGATTALELGETRAHRVLGRELTRAERDDRGEPFGALIANEEREQVEACAVGPVDILDHERHRPLLAKAAQDPEHKLEQPGLTDRARDARAGVAELGQQPRQLAAGGAEKLGQVGLAPFPDHGAEGSDDRSVRKLGLREVDALADETRARPALAARRANSLTKRLLPIPASPNNQRRASVDPRRLAAPAPATGSSS